MFKQAAPLPLIVFQEQDLLVLAAGLMFSLKLFLYVSHINVFFIIIIFLHWYQRCFLRSLNQQIKDMSVNKISNR